MDCGRRRDSLGCLSQNGSLSGGPPEMVLAGQAGSPAVEWQGPRRPSSISSVGPWPRPGQSGVGLGCGVLSRGCKPLGTVRIRLPGGVEVQRDQVGQAEFLQDCPPPRVCLNPWDRYLWSLRCDETSQGREVPGQPRGHSMPSRGREEVRQSQCQKHTTAALERRVAHRYRQDARACPAAAWPPV